MDIMSCSCSGLGSPLRVALFGPVARSACYILLGVESMLRGKITTATNMSKELVSERPMNDFVVCGGRQNEYHRIKKNFINIV